MKTTLKELLDKHEPISPKIADVISTWPNEAETLALADHCIAHIGPLVEALDDAIYYLIASYSEEYPADHERREWTFQQWAEEYPGHIAPLVKALAAAKEVSIP